MDALFLFLAVLAIVLAFGALSFLLGEDSRSFGNDGWARPWSSD